MRAGEFRIKLDRLADQFLASEIALGGKFIELRCTELVQVPGPQVLARPLSGLALLGQAEFGFDAGSDKLGNLILKIEDIDLIPVEPFGPDAVFRLCVHDLDRYAKACAGLSDSTRNDIVRVELLADPANAVFGIAERKCWIARHNRKPSVFREGGRDIFCDAIGDIVFVWIIVQVRERQHRDGRPFIDIILKHRARLHYPTAPQTNSGRSGPLRRSGNLDHAPSRSYAARPHRLPTRVAPL